MGDFVNANEVDDIRKHYRDYLASEHSKKDNRSRPESGVCDGSTFREVSSWYINRLLRFIEMGDFVNEMNAQGAIENERRKIINFLVVNCADELAEKIKNGEHVDESLIDPR